MGVEASDLELVQRSRSGEQEAFRLLVHRYQRRLYGVCFSMVRNRDDALDLVQETLLKIHRYLDRFEGGSFVTWSYRIATNVCIDHLRKQRRFQHVEFDDSRDVGEEEEGLTSWQSSALLRVDPERLLRKRELLRKIDEAIEDLSPIHRQVITLREVEGLSYQEIADIAEISLGTVMSRLHHARKRVQARLLPYLETVAQVTGEGA